MARFSKDASKDAIDRHNSKSVRKIKISSSQHKLAGSKSDQKMQEVLSSRAESENEYSAHIRKKLPNSLSTMNLYNQSQ